MWLALAHAAGIVAADRWGPSVPVALATLVAAGALGVRARAVAPRAACALLALAAAGALSHSADLERATRHAPVTRATRDLEARVCAHEGSPGRARLELCDAVAADGGAPLPERLRVYAEGPASQPWGALRRGDRVRARLEVGPVEGLRNPGSRDRAAALRRRGIGAEARPAHPALAVLAHAEDAPSPAARLSAWRARVGGRLAAAGPGGGLLEALALGDRSALSEADRRRFASLGLAHLLAVSGLHLGLVAGVVFALARRVLVRVGPLARSRDVRGPALGAGLAAATVYAAITGPAVPALRAWVFVVALGATLAAGRRLRPGQALAAAALLVSTSDPSALFATGAQLSFAASVALAAAWRRGVPGPAPARLLAQSAVALAATAPLVALHGGSPSPWALAANAVAVPWTAALLLPASLAAAAAAACPRAPGAGALVDLGEAIARASLHAVAAGARAVGPPPPPVAVAPAVAILAALAACGVVRTPSTAARVTLALAISIGLRRAPLPSGGPLPAPPRLVALDVGHGDAVLVQGARAAVLVDAGWASPDGYDAGRDVVAPALRALGVARLDLLVVSHGDLDHRGGAPAVLRALPVAEVWLPPGGLRAPELAAVRRAARRAGALLRERGAGDAAARRGDLVVEPLWPPRGAGRSRGAAPTSRNDASLVVAVRAGRWRALLLGDLEAPGEEALVASGAPLGADVLKLAHHGSATSSRPRLLEAVGAQIAVVPAACRRAGLPAAPVLRRVAATGAALWWTGRDGAVLLGLGDPLVAWAWGEGPRPCLPRTLRGHGRE